MNILLVSHYYLPHTGGLEVVVDKQAKSLATHNKVTLITCAAEGSTPGTTDEQGFRVHRVKSSNFFDTHFGIPFVLPSPAILPLIIRCVKQADVVHVHDVFYMTSWISYVVARFYRKPVFLTQHVAEVKHPNPMVMFIQRAVYGTIGARIFRGSKAIVVYNPIVKNFLLRKGVPAQKIHEFRNGVDTVLFRSAEHDEKNATRRSFNLPIGKVLVLFVGRFVPKKGFDALLKARSEDYELVFVGSGNFPQAQRNLPGVHFLGILNHEQIAKLYRAVDIFALPAQGEFCTLAMQEAMASGLPVLTTPEPEYYQSDLKTDLVSLVPPTAEAIKEELLRLTSNEALRTEMGAYALQYATKNFDWSKNIQPLFELYETVKEKRGVTVTTSWDDGHKLDFKLAELLTKYDIRGTFYISPNDTEIPPQTRLTDKEIITLSERFEIGAHTMTHAHLTKQSDEDARNEIYNSKRYLEKVIDKPVESFCYPAGHYRARHTQMVREAGFKLGRTVKRFATSTVGSPFELATSIHGYRHWSDAWSILTHVGFKDFLNCYLNWDELAIRVFDQASKTGGVFHLWGHSWEIDKNGDWRRLERVLQHINTTDGVRRVVNSELV